MSILKKLSENSTVIFIAVVLIVLFVPSVNRYINSKSSYGYESMDKTNNPAYNKNNSNSSGGVVPSEALGQNEVFASINGIQTSTPGMPSSCSKPNIQNPSDLLPKDNNNQWAQLNPSGKGDLQNQPNLLKAGYHIGIDTIGQTLRNPNLQIRSEPPNPQLDIGPWNQSTITSDFMRVPFEIGSGAQ
jgi:hypothetical protein